MSKKSLSTNVVILTLLVTTVIVFTLIFSTNLFRSDNSTIRDFSYQDSNSKSGHLYQYRDKAVILHFWATWCIPCRAELPELLHKAEKTPDTIFLLISVDQNKQEMISFLTPYKNALSSNIVLINDPDMTITGKHFGIDRFPETIILHKDKTIAQHIYGATAWGEY